MAGKHPYISSGGPLVQAITQFRKSFPSTVDATTLKKLGIAPNNESYLINILKFLGLINEDGKKTEEASKVFVLHKDEDFQKAFSKTVQNSYSELFELQNEDAWGLDEESLITYFRQTDQSSEIVGKRQAVTFGALAGLSGKRELSAPKSSRKAVKKTTSSKTKAAKKKSLAPPSPGKGDSERGHADAHLSENAFGLTVRLEINIPADGTQATYDRIFKSIRENLIDAYRS